MTEERYNQRKWELLREWRCAFPHFPKVGLARKKMLTELVAEYHSITKDEARAAIEQWGEEFDKQTNIEESINGGALPYWY